MKRPFGLFLLVATCLSLMQAAESASSPPLRLAIVGLSHGHADRFVAAVQTRTDVQLVGIVESDLGLVAKTVAKHHLPATIFADRLEDLLARGEVQAVAVFTTTFDHRRVVELCAPRGVHVMMEKPLAVNMEHARAIAAAAKASGIHVLVNYEPTWSPAYQEAFAQVHNRRSIGDIRKFVAHDGNNGPVAGKAPAEFVRWLTDPKLNGGGALYDFGCYGAAMLTALLDGQRPVSVQATLQNFKPDDYRAVEDEATVVVTYPRAVGILMASWNWPATRKDFEVYGSQGYLYAGVPRDLTMKGAGGKEQTMELPPSPAPWTDSISYFSAVISGRIKPSGLPALNTNMLVTEILDAARESARTGRRVDLP